MFDKLWCLHDAEPRSGPINMAFDEVMLELAAERAAPVLRTYRWSEPFVSIGFFDRLALVNKQFPGRLMVRRWTGGGAVDHRADFTFALAVPVEHPLARQLAADRYREIHASVAHALNRFGIRSQSAGRVVTLNPGAAPAPCFDAAVCGDLLSDGRKIVGGAQRRTRSGVLHQGSIQAPALAVDWPMLGRELAAALAHDVAALELDARFIDRAESLARDKYAKPGWLHAR